MGHEILVTLTRGNLDESHHYGAYCVFEKGRVVRQRGDIETPFFLRSAAKPAQALAVVESGAVERFGFDDEELAMVVGSHAGSPRHARVAASMLEKAGASPDLLRCGGHKPLSSAVHEDYVRRGYKPGRLEDNCSGKHAGMIAAAKAMGADPARYAERTHPLQRKNLANLALLTGVPEQRIGLGTDGCAVPSFAVPVAAMARFAALFGTPDELPDGTAAAARRITDAVLAHPDMVAGERLFDTEVMRSARTHLLCKGGAEGVQIVSAVGQGIGFAVKVLDGGKRAVHAVTAALLFDFGWAKPEDLVGLYPRQVRTREGEPVGEFKVRL